MIRTGPYCFKRAESSSEIEQVHSLNYATFVREIPQHADPGIDRLVDKFHEKNVYFIALRDERVVGMLSVHDQPPFSVADRLPDPAMLGAPGIRPLEIRLLAVHSAERHGTVFAGLAWSVMRHVQQTGHTHLFISGFEERLSMYEGLGFKALGPAVGAPGARFVPMCLAAREMERLHAQLVNRWTRHINQTQGASSR